MASASFRQDEIDGANDADQAVGPLFVLFLIGYAVGLGMGLPWPLAFLGMVPTYLFARLWTVPWRRWCVPWLERHGL